MNEPHLLLMRHGRTDANDEGLVQGRGDLPLNEVGRLEVIDTARRLGAFEINELWSSPRPRARESSDIVARALGLEDVHEDARLDEIDCGTWSGRRWDELRRDHRWRLYLRDPDRFTLPDGESYDSLRQRVESFASAHDVASERLLIVSHLDTLRMLVAVMSGVTFRQARESLWATGEALEATLTAGLRLRDLEGQTRVQPTVQG